MSQLNGIEPHRKDPSRNHKNREVKKSLPVDNVAVAERNAAGNPPGTSRSAASPPGPTIERFPSSHEPPERVSPPRSSRQYTTEIRGAQPSVISFQMFPGWWKMSSLSPMLPERSGILSRYDRQQRTRGGTELDERWSRLRILLVGCGGVGTPLAQSLVRGGIGTL
ncbi:MAG TPA: hypothetical protein EYO84_05795, partial [Planctomycetes bacterium]|nr:hypothetical protein [Planctomycetota bacterium]